MVACPACMEVTLEVIPGALSFRRVERVRDPHKMRSINSVDDLCGC